MAFVYRVYERKNSIPNAKTPKVAVANTKLLGVVSTKQLAEDIADRCTVHRSDVVAVLDALSLSATSFITQGFGVRLGGLGSLSTRITCKSAPTKEEFKPDLLKRVHLRFTPSLEIKERMARTKMMNIDEYDTRVRAQEEDPEVVSPGAPEDSETPGGGEAIE